MMVAEELDVEWANVSIESMPLSIVKTDEGFAWKHGSQGAGGSTGVTDNWNFMRVVGATVRQMLLQAAAEKWQVPIGQCSTRPGFVVCQAIAKKISYGELAMLASKQPLPTEELVLKKLSEYRIVGKRLNFVDAQDIVTGKTQYGIDTRMPGMKFAVIARSPYLNGSVESWDDTETMKVSGVHKVIKIDGPEMGAPYLILADGVAVIADSTWGAIKGRLARLLKFVAERADYGKKRPKGRAVGLATHFTFGGYAAHAIRGHSSSQW
ncbi:MAG: isoquinoline 1-oxidoreductase beta subunit [Lysobacterales bacterium]|jgi:isoquinoline 1-oxidoreductase beta subunit